MTITRRGFLGSLLAIPFTRQEAASHMLISDDNYDGGPYPSSRPRDLYVTRWSIDSKGYFPYFPSLKRSGAIIRGD